MGATRADQLTALSFVCLFLMAAFAIITGMVAMVFSQETFADRIIMSGMVCPLLLGAGAMLVLARVAWREYRG